MLTHPVSTLKEGNIPPMCSLPMGAVVSDGKGAFPPQLCLLTCTEVLFPRAWGAVHGAACGWVGRLRKRSGLL